MDFSNIDISSLIGSGENSSQPNILNAVSGIEELIGMLKKGQKLPDDVDPKLLQELKTRAGEDQEIAKLVDNGIKQGLMIAMPGIGHILTGVDEIGGAIAQRDEYGVAKNKFSAGLSSAFSPIGRISDTIGDISKDGFQADDLLNIIPVVGGLHQRKDAVKAKEMAQKKTAAKKEDEEQLNTQNYFQNKYSNAGQQLADGGKVQGKGTAKSDSIKTSLDDGAFVVPAENAVFANQLGKELLGWDSNQKAKKGGSNKVALSNGEVVFQPDEVEKLFQMGIDLNSLAPDAEPSNKLKKGGEVKGYVDGGGIGKDFTPSELQAINKAAKSLKISPQEMMAIVLQESSGNAKSVGGDNNGYKGLIQWGKPEREKELPRIADRLGIEYDGDPTNNSFEEQMDMASEWIKSRGFQPGKMGADKVYATILGGNPDSTATDSNGTKANNNPNIKPGGKYYQEAEKLFNTGEVSERTLKTKKGISPAERNKYEKSRQAYNEKQTKNDQINLLIESEGPLPNTIDNPANNVIPGISLDEENLSSVQSKKKPKDPRDGKFVDWQDGPTDNAAANAIYNEFTAGIEKIRQTGNAIWDAPNKVLTDPDLYWKFTYGPEWKERKAREERLDKLSPEEEAKQRKAYRDKAMDTFKTQLGRKLKGEKIYTPEEAQAVREKIGQENLATSVNQQEDSSFIDIIAPIGFNIENPKTLLTESRGDNWIDDTFGLNNIPTESSDIPKNNNEGFGLEKQQNENVSMSPEIGDMIEKSNKSFVIPDWLNAGNVLSAAQIAYGSAGLLNQGNRPEDTIGEGLSNWVEQLRNEEADGFTTDEWTGYTNEIENIRRNDLTSISSMMGGDAGLAMASIIETGNRANKAVTDLAVADSSIRRQEEQRIRGQRGQAEMFYENRRSAIKDKEIAEFDQNQAAFAEMLNAGIGNLIGNNDPLYRKYRGQQ